VTTSTRTARSNPLSLAHPPCSTFSAHSVFPSRPAAGQLVSLARRPTESPCDCPTFPSPLTSPFYLQYPVAGQFHQLLPVHPVQIAHSFTILPSYPPPNHLASHVPIFYSSFPSLLTAFLLLRFAPSVSSSSSSKVRTHFTIPPTLHWLHLHNHLSTGSHTPRCV